ncbi:MAG: hypothetical protein QNJ90_16040, partial [Planctomycetota bacterium]|nr:hypothetical protein [Planctomycetota bacterium]
MTRGLLLVVLLILPVVAVQAAPEERPEVTRGELKDLVKRFANDKMKGRESGEPECDQAADMIAAEYARLGLRPLGNDSGSFFQPFTSPRGIRVLDTTALSATNAKGKSTAFKILKDFVPHDEAGSGRVTAKAAFAGYGIADAQLQYDDYEGLDVTGRVVIVLRRAPRWQDKRKSPFAPQHVMMRVGTFKAKVDAAVARGAAALIVVNDPASTSKSDDEVGRPGGTANGKIPVIHMTYAAGKRLASRLGLSLSKLQRRIDAKFSPHSSLVDDATVTIHCDLEPDQR